MKVTENGEGLTKSKFARYAGFNANMFFWGFPGGSVSNESTCKAGDPGLIPGSGRSPGEGNGNPSRILAGRIPWTEEPGGL